MSWQLYSSRAAIAADYDLDYGIRRKGIRQAQIDLVESGKSGRESGVEDILRRDGVSIEHYLKVCQGRNLSRLPGEEPRLGIRRSMTESCRVEHDGLAGACGKFARNEAARELSSGV